MAILTEYLTQHDLQPTYKVTVVDSSAVAIDLTSAVIRVNMRLEDSTALTLNRSTAGITITSATSGQFEYAWQVGDTDSTGTFDIEFEVTPNTGGKFTIPNKIPSQSTSVGVAKVVIKAGLDAT
jgi:hypothetical protein